MVQLLDRYRRLSDGKTFAVVSLGALSQSMDDAWAGRLLTLEAEDGERIEFPLSVVRGHGRFERIED